MFKFLLLLFIGTVLIACQNQNKTIQSKMNESAKKTGIEYNVYESFDTIPNYQAVSPSLFKQIINFSKTVVIDVRTPDEIETGKVLDTALEIDFYRDDFDVQLEKLDKNVPYAVYCRSGNRSKATLKKLKEKGFKEVYHLYGGINAWKEFISSTNN